MNTEKPFFVAINNTLINLAHVISIKQAPGKHLNWNLKIDLINGEVIELIDQPEQHINEIFDELKALLGVTPKVNTQ